MNSSKISKAAVRILKKTCAVSLSALMLMGAGLTEAGAFVSASLPVYAATAETPASSFEYKENDNGGITIKKFTGSETEVVIPKTIGGKHVTAIGVLAFYYRESLTSITIPDSVTSIGDEVFNHCTSLTSITIPDSVTSIGEGAFLNCTSLTSITIPDSVTSIGDEVFNHCTSLTSITIPDSVTSIGEMAFSDCTSLTSITIPDSVTSIGEKAFYDCTSLTSITIPDSVTSIGERAFYNCTSLTSITIPDSVTFIGGRVFGDCTSLTSISVSSDNRCYSSIDGVLFSKDKKTLLCCPEGKSGSYSIPDSVTSIGGNAFFYCTSLTSIIIPDSVTSIGYNAFFYCTSLTSINIPDSVTKINYETFANCNSLTSINIPDSVTKIDFYAFYACTSLTSITIPDSVTSIGEKAFSCCTSLTSISVSSGNRCYASIDEVLFSKDKKTILCCPGGKSGSYSIPNSVTSIGKWAFLNCTSLTSITIPDSVTEIGSYAFEYCTNLTSITIPDSVTSIGSSAFRNCTSLTSITIPDSVTSIGVRAFAYCNSLTSITIPDSVTSIGEGTFSDCTSLTSITIPDSVTVIVGWAFAYCSSLISITIPDSVTSIGSYAFRNCTNLTIYGYSGSAAETYAKRTGIPFAVVKYAESIKLNKTSTVITRGSSETLTAAVKPDDTTDKTIVWTTSSNNVATVDNSGKVTAVGGGYANITAKTVNGLTAVCEVRVVIPISECTVTISPTSYTYDGSVKKPSVTVMDGTKTLVSGTDYTVVYSNNLNAGTASVTVTGMGNYTGSVTKSYTILSKTITDSMVTISPTSYTYDGSVKKPSVTVMDGTKTLVSGTDYTVVYSNNLNAGTASVKVSGMGSYAGSVTKSYTILSKTITDSMVTISPTSYTYDGSVKKPSVTVMDGTKTLVSGTDYTVSYRTVSSVGTGSVTVTGMGNYTGTVTKTFTISRRSITNASMTLSADSFQYDGTEKKPTVTVKIGSTVLKENRDYTLAYSDCTDIGTAQVTASGIGNYSGKISKTYEILSNSLKNAVVSLSKESYYYDGTAKKPAVTVSMNGKTLTADYYTVVYRNNIEAGTASVIVSGRNGFEGSVTKKFTILTRSLKNADIILSSSSYTYSGVEKKPAVTVKLGDMTVDSEAGYTIQYADNINAGTAIVTVTGQKNFTGTCQTSFLIKPKSIADAVLELPQTEYDYSGSERKPEIRVLLGGKELSKENYTVSYSNNTNVGTAQVTVTGIGNYQGELTSEFRIISNSRSFSIGTDSWSFTNSADTFGNHYSILQDDWNYLLDKWNDIGNNIEAEDLPKLLSREWTGSCYGMAVTSILGYYKYFKPDEYKENAKNTFEIEFSDKVESLINYYHVIQFTPKIKTISADAFKEEEHDKVAALLDYLDEKKPVLFTYQWDDVENPMTDNINLKAHAVVAYGKKIETSTKTKDGFTYDTIVYIYDNDINLYSEDCCVYLNTKNKSNYQWYIPKHKCGSIKTTVNKNTDQIGIVTNDLSIINYMGLKEGSTKDSTEDFKPILTSSQVQSEITWKSFDEYSSGGYNATDDDDDIFYFASVMGDNTTGSFNVRLGSSKKGYIMKLKKPEPQSVSMRYPDCRIKIDTNNTNTLSFFSNGFARCDTKEGKTTDYSLDVVFNEGHYSGNWYHICVSGSGVNWVRLTPDSKGRGYWLKADRTLGKIKITASSKKYGTKELTITSSCKKVLICERPDHTIGIDLTNTSKLSAKTLYLGKSITIKASADGGKAPYTYAAWYKKTTSSSYLSIRGYKSDREIVFLPKEAGEYDICVKVKDQDGRTKVRDFTVTVKQELTNLSTISSDSILLGENITIACGAKGGSSPYQYAAFYKKAASSSYTSIRGYTSGKTITFQPKAAVSYSIRVKVKDSTGKVVVKDFTVTVKKKLTNTSVLSSNQIRLGQSAVIRCSASGGQAPYQYAAWYKKESTSNYTLLRNYAEGTSITVKPGAAVSYSILVKVKDSSGAVASKKFTLTVSKT